MGTNLAIPGLPGGFNLPNSSGNNQPQAGGTNLNIPGLPGGFNLPSVSNSGPVQNGNGTGTGSGPNSSNGYNFLGPGAGGFQLQPQSNGPNVYQASYNLGNAASRNNPMAGMLQNWMSNPYQSPNVPATAPGYNNFNGTSSNTPLSPYGAGVNNPMPAGYTGGQMGVGANALPTNAQGGGAANNYAQVPYAGTPGPSNGPNPGMQPVNNMGNSPYYNPQTNPGGMYNGGTGGGGVAPNTGGSNPIAPSTGLTPVGGNTAQGQGTSYGGYNYYGQPGEGNPFAYMTGQSSNGLNGTQYTSTGAAPGMFSQQPLSFGYGNLNPLTTTTGGNTPQSGNLGGLAQLLSMMGL